MFPINVIVAPLLWMDGSNPMHRDKTNVPREPHREATIQSVCKVALANQQNITCQIKIDHCYEKVRFETDDKGTILT